MKKNVFLLVMVVLLCSCSTSTSKPDKRDKYVGEYKLYEGIAWSGERKWSGYDTQYISGVSDDSTHVLVVTKDLNDTISLTFDIVRPFDFEFQKEIIAENERIKKKNEQSICGEDEPLIEVPQPTYSNDRELIDSYKAYVEGHKIFLKDYEKRNDYRSYEKVTFDSVYLRNDTIHFIIGSYVEEYNNYEKSGYIAKHRRCYGVKLTDSNEEKEK